MKMSDLRAKARAIFGPAIAEPMPNMPNGAKALQQRANARPIPTYKDGGAIKKPVLTPAERKMGDALMMTKKGKDVMAYQDRMAADKDKKMAAKRAMADKLLGIPAQKSGGKAGCYADGGKVEDTRIAARMAAGNYKKGGKVQTSSDTARKLATEMGGMKKGGKPKKDGLAVMIAIGKPMKAPKKMNGGAMGARDVDMEASKVTRRMAVGGAGKVRKGQAPIKKAQGGAAKVRKGMMTPTGDIKQVVTPKKGIGGM